MRTGVPQLAAEVMEGFLSTVLGMLAMILATVVALVSVAVGWAWRRREKKRLAAMRRSYCCLRAAYDKRLRTQVRAKSLK